MSKGVSGFTFHRDREGFKVRYEMPSPLLGAIDVRLIARGPLLDGTRGIPERIAERLGLDAVGGMVAPWQVHGRAIIEGRRIWALPQRVLADGVHIDAAFDPGFCVTVSLRFADCAPVLLAAASPKPWAIIVHSGFRGTLARVLEAALDRAVAFYGRSVLRDTFVWIGPSVGFCCYTRRLSDPSAIQAMEEWGPAASRVEGDQVHLDIAGVLREQALGRGIPPSHVFSSCRCTSCEREHFYSYRQGDGEDRMLLLAKRMPQNGENV